MAKFLLGAAATTIAATAIFATSANAIDDMATCMSEGGSAFDLNGTQVCLVPIRAPEWSDPVYDGNQLGIIECTGKTINDGSWCLEPFGGAALPSVETKPKPTQADLDAMTQSGLETASETVTETATEAVEGSDL